jgi:predicted nucleic acid-binding protein
MPTGKTIKYCWDSCVFISLLTLVGRTDEELANLQAVERLSDNGDVQIFTASITLVEVLACKLTDEQERMFRELLHRTNVTAVSVTPRIAAKAREIRNYYATKGMNIAVPDSIHLATAVHYDATALHTYDGGGKRFRATDLLQLEAPLVERWALKICKPEPPPTDQPEVDEPPCAVAENMNLFSDILAKEEP